MTSFADLPQAGAVLPDHTQLPESDGTFVKNFQEHPQSILLTDSIKPVLDQLHPDGQYCIGQDSGIYWRMMEPPERGAEAPDWFYVPNVPPLLSGQARRSYVLWQEHIPPLIALEFVSGNGSEERDKTPWTGKFWIYEQVIRPAFYGIYEVTKARIEVYCLVANQYQLLPANERGHYSISPLGVELGIWQGEYQSMNLPWLRWWDAEGNLLLTGEERVILAERQIQAERQRAEQERQRAEQERQRAEQERQRAEQLAAQLRALGVNPDL
jgi:Uma2 family endonuclease